jgi:hypothetical protein
MKIIFMKKRLIITLAAIVLSSILLIGCSQKKSDASSSLPANPPLTQEDSLPSSTTTTETTTVNPSTVISSSTSTKATQPSTQIVPLQYLSLYTSLQQYVSDEDKQISVQWDGSIYPVNYAAELLTADTNAGPGILQSNERQVMLAELNGELTMGVKAVTVEIGFPVFDPNFYIFSGQSADQAQESVQTWLNYYESLAQAIHNLGLKMIVESNPLLTYYISSQSSFNPGSYYKSLDFVTYQKLRSEHNVIIAQQIKPDYLLLQTEPQTDAVNDFRPELNNATKDTAMISNFVTALENARIPGLHTSIQLGSGAGTWQPGWKSYFSGLMVIPGLDKIDTHIYNLQPDVNQLGEVAIAMQIADMAHSVGKGVTMSEFWFHKSTSLVGLTEAGDTLTDIRARDMFSFWAPLDEQSFQMLSKLANYKHFDYVSAFGHYNWFALTDYNSLQSPPIYPAITNSQNEVVDNQITSLQNQLAKQALNNNQLSPTGKAYQAIISNPPAP